MSLKESTTNEFLFISLFFFPKDKETSSDYLHEKRADIRKKHYKRIVLDFFGGQKVKEKKFLVYGSSDSSKGILTFSVLSDKENELKEYFETHLLKEKCGKEKNEK